jgi:hypothetical protein
MNVFLQTHAPLVFEEVQVQYVEVLSKLYASFFKVLSISCLLFFICQIMFKGLCDWSFAS